MSSGIFNALAGIYVDVISPIGPRIQVTGSPDILQNSSIQAKVRALLLLAFVALFSGNKSVATAYN